MGLILWIDENTFATQLLEKVFKQQEQAFYTLDNVRDFSFLVDDLRPEVIVLDLVTAQKDLDLFKNQFDANERLRETSFIVIGDNNEFRYLRTIGEIKRPFDPYTIPEIISKFKNYH